MKKITLYLPPKRLSRQRGIGLIEVLLVISIISVAAAALFELSNLILRANTGLKNKTIATNLAAEAIEATRAIKEEDWNIISSLASETDYHPAITGSPQKWSLASGPETIEGFSRKLIFSAVLRDADDDIALTGTLDSQTKKVTSIVSWQEQGRGREIILTAYLANWKP